MSENSIGVVFGPSDGTSLRDVLLGIRSKRGQLSEEIVVEEASDPKHPLHHRFEWNDAVAGHKYRLEQAGRLLRVTYKVSLGDGSADLRAFVVPRRADGVSGVYEPLEEVVADPMSREIMLREMRRDWQNFKRRYQHMQEFVNLVTDVLVEPDGNGNGNGTDQPQAG